MNKTRPPFTVHSFTAASGGTWEPNDPGAPSRFPRNMAAGAPPGAPAAAVNRGPLATDRPFGHKSCAFCWQVESGPPPWPTFALELGGGASTNSSWSLCRSGGAKTEGRCINTGTCIPELAPLSEAGRAAAIQRRKGIDDGTATST